MGLPYPTSLSPSKVSSFRSCALAFRFSAIDRLPEPPTLPTARGTLVHKALEHFFWGLAPEQRTREAASLELARAVDDVADELDQLGLDDAERAQLGDDGERLLDGYFAIEDPTRVNVMGVELNVETHLDGVLLRGIIDRLDVGSDGSLVVTDYKTGRPPSVASEASSMIGVNFYAVFCEEIFGVRPSRIQLLYLREPMVLSTEPSEQAMAGVRRKTAAIWSAVRRACATDDFRPHPSALCGWCNWKAFCPAFGGDPALAKAQASPAGAAPGADNTLAPPLPLLMPASG